MSSHSSLLVSHSPHLGKFHNLITLQNSQKSQNPIKTCNYHSGRLFSKIMQGDDPVI